MRIGFLILAVIVVCGFIFWKDIKSVGVKGLNVVNKEKNEPESVGNSTVKVMEKWNLPEELREISGIAYLDDSRFACIQDEDGKIFIYNHAEKKVEKEIPFAGAGDYEDIAISGQTAWVVRADGKLFEVPLNKGKSAVKEHKTSLTVEHNVEGLAYDSKGNRLLLAIKDDEPGNKDYKGIYAYDLTNNSFNSSPVFKIDVSHKLFESTGDKKKKKTIKPSAIAIHPTNGDIYITDGPKSMLLVMDKAGSIREWVTLGKEFEQPEGIAFNPAGELFISNEGGKGTGNILKVSL